MLSVKAVQHFEHLFSRKNITFATCCVVMLGSGTLYAKSIWTPVMKRQQEFSPFEISLIGVFGDYGIYLGALVGIFHDKFGPRATAFLASSSLFLGYFLIYASLRDFIPKSYLSIAFYLFVVGQGSHAGYIYSLVSAAKWFHLKHRGKLTGTLSSLLALSSFVIGNIYAFFFQANNDITNFILLLCIYTSTILLLSSFIIRHPPQPAESSVIVVSSSPSTVPLGAERVETGGEGEKDREDTESRRSIEVLESRSPPQSEEGQITEIGGEKEAERNEITGIALLKNKLFWLIFVPFCFTVGSGLMFVNHMGELAFSLGAEKSHSLVVMLFSLFNALGRFMVGFISDQLTIYGYSQSNLFVFCVLVSALSHGYFAFCQNFGMVILGTPFLAFSYGGMFAVTQVIVSIFFGLKNFGQNWGWIQIGPAFGNLAFNLIASKLYQSQIEDGGNKCLGSGCYRYAFVVSSSVCCCVAVPLSLFFYFHMRESKMKTKI